MPATAYWAVEGNVYRVITGYSVVGGRAVISIGYDDGDSEGAEK
jgi:hypothetical protein